MSKLQSAAEKVLREHELVRVKATIDFDDKNVPIDALGMKAGDGRVSLLALSWPQLVDVNGEINRRTYEERQVNISPYSQHVVRRGELVQQGMVAKVLDSMIVATEMRMRGMKDHVILGKLLDYED